MLAIRQHHLPELVATISASAFAILCLLARRTTQRKHEKEQLLLQDGSQQSLPPQLPPYAPTTMMKTISALRNGQHPWFFLRLQKKILPIKLFRLPLPKLMAPNWIVIGDAKIATRILQDASTKRPTIGYEDIAKCIGSGQSIVTLEGAEWKHRRLATNVAFASHNLKRMGAVAKECTQHWMKTTLDDETRSFDVGNEMVRLTITIILEAALEYKATKSEAEYLSAEFLIASQEFTKVSGGLNPFRQLFGQFNAEVRRANLAKNNLFDFARKIIHLYRERTEANSDSNITCTLLRCIMCNPNYQNDDERASDIVMWMNAGFDSTGFSIAWLLIDLARNPSIVASLRNELKVIPQEDWHKSAPLRNICKESMRLHPVIPGGSLRLTGKSFIFEDMIIPKDSIVQLPSILYARDEDVFDNPNEFQPDRWDEKNKSQSMTETFLPYVAGRHNCAGQSFANVEVETVVSCLLGDYDFKMDVEGEEKYFITLKPVGARLFAIKS